MFFPLDNQPFVVPVALPGDDITPEKIIAFWCDGSKGLYIRPNIWHEGIFPVKTNKNFSTARAVSMPGSAVILGRNLVFICPCRLMREATK